MWSLSLKSLMRHAMSHHIVVSCGLMGRLIYTYIYIYTYEMYNIYLYICIYICYPLCYLPFLSPETQFDSSSSKIVIPSPRFRRFSCYKVSTKEFEEASNPTQIRDLIDF